LDGEWFETANCGSLIGASLLDIFILSKALLRAYSP
jgi:hypothetical protein